MVGGDRRHHLLEAAGGGQQGLAGALLARTTRGGPLGFLGRCGLLSVCLGCGETVGFRQAGPFVPIDALGFLLELSSQQCGRFRVHMRMDDLGALGWLFGGLLWSLGTLLVRRGAVEATYLLEGVLNYPIDVLHVTGAAVLIP